MAAPLVKLLRSIAPQIDVGWTVVAGALKRRLCSRPESMLRISEHAMLTLMLLGLWLQRMFVSRLLSMFPSLCGKRQCSLCKIECSANIDLRERRNVRLGRLYLAPSTYQCRYHSAGTHQTPPGPLTNFPCPGTPTPGKLPGTPCPCASACRATNHGLCYCPYCDNCPNWRCTSSSRRRCVSSF